MRGELGPEAFLARRYLKSRRRSRGVGAPVLAWVGLTIGVLALNGVLAVMNGFQLTFIENLLELSSSHLRWTPPSDPGDEALAARIEALEAVPGVRSALPAVEGQTLVSSTWGDRQGAVIRGLPTDAGDRDPAWSQRLTWTGGRGGLPEVGEAVLGASLAWALGVVPGDRVLLTALTGPGFSLLKPRQIEFTVKATFTTGYYEIDGAWVILNLDDARQWFAGPRDLFVAVKLVDGNRDLEVARALGSTLPPAELTTWRDYNSAFFGALRTEKAVMLVLVGLIFFVVGVNLYHSQKRAVAEHREDLALWAAVGVRPARLRRVFALEGLAIGSAAALAGTLLGLLVAWAFAVLPLLPSDAFYLPSVPTRVLPAEVAWIAGACVLSSTLAAWWASAGVTRIPVAEVLKAQ